MGYTPNDGYGLQPGVMWMPPDSDISVTCVRRSAARRRVHLRHMTNESKFTPVKPDSSSCRAWSSLVAPVKPDSPTLRAWSSLVGPVKPNFFRVFISRVKSSFEVQVKSSGASTRRGGSADIELNGTVLRTTADVITRE